MARIEFGDKAMRLMSGQVAFDGDGNLVGGNDMTAQAAFIMDNIAAILVRPRCQPRRRGQYPQLISPT